MARSSIRFPDSFALEDNRAITSQSCYSRGVLAVGGLAIGLEVLDVLSGLSSPSVIQRTSLAISVLVLIALTIELFSSFSSRHEVAWYDSRAAAESIKTLYWRYLVCGRPFGLGLTHEEADEILEQSIGEILTGLGRESEGPFVDGETKVWAHQVRSSSLAERIDLYRQRRVEDQLSWYLKKSQDLRRRSRILAAVSFLCTLAVLVLAIVATVRSKPFQFNDPIFQIAVVTFGYAGIRQYSKDSRVYEFTASEIRNVHSELASIHSESQWDTLVDEIEKVFSREHVTWQTSRAGKKKSDRSS